MDVKELRALDRAGLEGKLAEQRKALFDARFSHAAAQLENTSSLPETRRSIARILTILKEKEQG
jgi:large subunit ribosomal protein L29